MLANAKTKIMAAIEPQIRLGLDDLRRAIEHRLTGDPLTKEQIATIVAALSTAASEIERTDPNDE